MSGMVDGGKAGRGPAYRLGRCTGRGIRLVCKAGRKLWRITLLRRGVKGAIAATLILALIVVGINAHIVFGTADDRYLTAAEVPRVAASGDSYQAAIVLGALVWEGGRPSYVLEDRLATALELYRLGRVPKILVSGDHGREAYDEVNAMATWLIAAGVPEADVFMDHAGFNTYDTMLRASRVFGVTRAVVVTQGFHLPRAVWLARHAGIEAVGLKADRRRYRKELWNESRETLARVKCVYESIAQRDPKYLGPAISIEGDGRLTWDDKMATSHSSSANNYSE